MKKKYRVYCVETTDFARRKIVFTESQRAAKAVKHHELRQEDFIARVKTTIERPHFVYRDYANQNRSVYYFREYRVNSGTSSTTFYTKVVVEHFAEPGFVVTAYRLNYVKERGKCELIFGEDKD